MSWKDGVPVGEDRVEDILSFMNARFREAPLPTGITTYVPQETDVIVSTFPKAGTTLLQQLCYQTAILTESEEDDWNNKNTRKDGESFVDICDVAPWLDYVPLMESRGFFASYSSPRVFKTHADASRFQRGRQRVVVGLRDPMRFAGSWLDYQFDNYPISLFREISQEEREELFHRTVAKDLLGLDGVDQAFDIVFPQAITSSTHGTTLGPWTRFVKGWLDQLGSRHVLVLCYEDVIQDPLQAAQQVARFMGRTLHPEALPIIRQRTSRDYMIRSNAFRSDWDHRLFGFESTSAKARPHVRNGFVNFQMRPEHVGELRDQMRSAFGVDDYQSLRSLVASKQSDNNCSKRK